MCIPEPLYCSSEDHVQVIKCNGCGHYKSCKSCGQLENPSNMLICDHCQEAFHLTCCNQTVENLQFDEWYCKTCMNKKREVIFGVTRRGRPIEGRSNLSEYRKKLRSGCSPITLMLDGMLPYTSGIRIGSAFQAHVPEWSCPIVGNSDYFDQPTELEPMEFSTFHVHKLNHSSTRNSTSNWLQCRQVKKDGSNGVICGKWRRAPLFEVQTEDWDCSCSIVWDPFHADCVVPQEIETEEVTRHLKYVRLLKARMASITTKHNTLDPA